MQSSDISVARQRAFRRVSFKCHRQIAYKSIHYFDLHFWTNVCRRAAAISAQLFQTAVCTSFLNTMQWVVLCKHRHRINTFSLQHLDLFALQHKERSGSIALFCVYKKHVLPKNINICEQLSRNAPAFGKMDYYYFFALLFPSYLYIAFRFFFF